MTRVFFSISTTPRMQQVASECARHLASKGIEVLVAEDSAFGERWDAHVWLSIRRADVVVAFFEQPSAAMGVELGFALGAQKQVLLVADSYAQIPPLLADMRVIPVASDHEELPTRLEKVVSQLASEQPREDLATNDVFHFAVVYRSDPGVLEHMSYEQFDHVVRRSFDALGYDPRPAPKGSGADLVLENFEGPHRVAVEVKKWPRTRKVPIGVVQQFLGSLFGQPVDAGLLLSTAEFTDSARDFATKTGGRVRLWNFDELAGRVVKDPRLIKESQRRSGTA